MVPSRLVKLLSIRDSKGNLVAHAVEKTSKKESLRSIIGRLTGNGETLILNMVRLANFTPIAIKLPDGTELAEPLVPTPAVALEANKWLAEQYGGKAVTQNEVDRTATENAIVEQLRALSDEELEQKVRELTAPTVDLERVEPEAEEAHADPD